MEIKKLPKSQAIRAILLGVLWLLSAPGPAAGQNAYPASCFEAGPLPTFAASYVDGTILFDYQALLADASSPRALSAQVQIRAWRVPCHTNGSALLIRVTSQLGLPLAPLVWVQQGEASVPVRLVSEANTLTVDDSGRQLLLGADASARLLVDSTAATDAAQIDFDDELTLVIRDSQFDRTLAFPAYSLGDYGVGQLQQISPRHSGTWFNRVREGEGLIVEITDSATSPQVVVSWYTYLAGRQQWLIGSAPLSAGARQITIPVVRTSGAGFGAAFDRNDVVREDWGELSLSFRDCQQLTLTYSGLDGSGDIALQRLTTVAELSCNN